YLAGIPVILAHGARDLGELIAGLALILVAVGIVEVARRAPVACGAVVGPLFFLTVASSFGLYPILSRTVLFLAPGLAMILVGRDLGDVAGRYAADVSRLRARRRVWVVLSDVANVPRHELVAALDRIATRRTSYQAGHDESAARVYLYVFS